MYAIITLVLLCRFVYASVDVPKLLLISFDGFRHDYIEKYNLSVFKRFAAQGGQAKRMQSCFTTVTLPNHFSLITGLYENRHGIISNEMFDPVTNETFNMRMADHANKWWSQNEYALPIWTLNQLKGNTRSSGAICWASSTCPFKGILPNKHLSCNQIKSFNHTIETVFEWFSDTDNPINFAAIYFDEPDKTGHIEGPNSDKMLIALHRLENVLEKIESKIRELNLSSLNVIIVSDHGMTEVNPNTSIVLTDYIDSNSYRAFGTTTVKNIFPKSNDLAPLIYRNLSNLKNFKVYTSDQLSRFHYSDNNRIGPIVLVADPGYLIFKSDIGKHNFTQKGNHGYHNFVEDMYAIFIGRGPSFRPNSTVENITVVDVFQLMIELLKLDRKIANKISKINGDNGGSLQATIPLLNYIPVNYDNSAASYIFYVVLIAMGSTLLVCIIATFGIIKTGWNICFSGTWLIRHWSGPEEASLV